MAQWVETIVQKWREDRLLTSQSLNSGLNLLEERIARTRLISYPRELHVGLTQRCNANCRHCNRKPYQAQSDMAVDLFHRLIDEVAKHVQNIHLVGVGEEALHPQFAELLEYLFDRSSANSLSITTNGTLFTNSQYTGLVAQFDSIYVSMSASRSSTYRKLVPGLRLKHVRESIRSALEERQRAGRAAPLVCAVFVAMRSNIDELPAFIDMCAETGIDTVAVQHLTVTRPEMREESLSLHQDISNTKTSEALSRIRANGLGIAAFPDPFPDDQAPPKKQFQRGGTRAKCVLPWRSARIESPGKVLPCCFFGGSATGDIRDSSFAAAWNGKPFRHLRTRVNGPNCPEPCRRCLPRNSNNALDDFCDVTLRATGDRC